MREALVFVRDKSLYKEGELAKKLDTTVKNYYKKVIENIPKGQVEEVLKSVNILQKAFERANPNCCQLLLPNTCMIQI